MSEKKHDCCHKQIISIPNKKLHGFPYKKIPHKSITLSQLSLSCFYALLEGFFWNAPQLCHLDDLYTFKMGSLDDSLNLGEKEIQNQENREVFPQW